MVCSYFTHFIDDTPILPCVPKFLSADSGMNINSDAYNGSVACVQAPQPYVTVGLNNCFVDSQLRNSSYSDLVIYKFAN